MPWLASLEPGVVALTEGSDAAVKSAGRLAGLGDVALVPVLAEGWAGTAVEAHVNAIEALLGRATGLPVQQRGRLEATRALLMFSQGDGDAAAAAEKAARAAPACADAWFAVGVIAMGEGRVRKAVDAFESCTVARAADLDCERGHIQALIELDRLEEADARASSPMMKAWVAAERGAAVDAVGPLAGYLEGLAALDAEGDQTSVAQRVAQSAEALATSPDPLARFLAPRAQALRLRLLGEGAPVGEVRELHRLHGRDPLVAVHLAARAEAIGDTSQAQRWLAEAAQDSPESARVHHARGLLHYSPQAMDRARTAWRRYLDLGPSGPRADRVRTRVGG